MFHLLGCACCNSTVYLSRARNQLNVSVGDRRVTLHCLPDGLEACRFTRMEIVPFSNGDTVTFHIWRTLSHDVAWAERMFGHIELGLRIIDDISMEAMFIETLRS